MTVSKPETVEVTQALDLCPFCGHPGAILGWCPSGSFTPERFTPYCTGSRCPCAAERRADSSLYPHWYGSERAAIAAWNRRHRLNATPSRQDGLREALEIIGGLPTGQTEDVMSGHENAYRAIESRLAALSDTPPPDNEETEALRGDLMKGLRTSQKTLDEITRQEQANIAGYLALRDFPVGAASALFPPDGVGPNKLGTDLPAIAAQLREISRISGKYDLRECIEGHDDALGDSHIWRDLMDQCDRLASAFNNGGK